MSNIQLITLLSRTPLSEEDKYNITVIFDALSSTRQQEILDSWDVCSGRLVSARKDLDYKKECEIIDLLRGVNTYLDEAKIRKTQVEEKRNKNKRQIRADLEATVAYDQMKRLQKIKSIGHGQSQQGKKEIIGSGHAGLFH